MGSNLHPKAAYQCIPCPPPGPQYNEPDAPVVAEAAEAEAYWKQVTVGALPSVVVVGLRGMHHR